MDHGDGPSAMFELYWVTPIQFKILFDVCAEESHSKYPRRRVPYFPCIKEKV
jgi:hypothetical protein